MRGKKEMLHSIVSPVRNGGYIKAPLIDCLGRICVSVLFRNLSNLFVCLTESQ
jgi:hypothetical protein